MLLWLSGFGLIMHLAHHGPRRELLAFGASQAVCLLALCFEAGYHESGRSRPGFLAYLRFAALLGVIAHSVVSGWPGLLQAP
jgi:hypothetical protein